MSFGYIAVSYTHLRHITDVMIAEILLKIRHFYFSLRGIHFHPESGISGVPIRSFRLVGKYGNINLR